MSLYQMEKLMAELETLPARQGLLMTDLLEMPETTRQFLQWIIRSKEVDEKEIAELIVQTESNTQTLIKSYIEHGMLEQGDLSKGKSYRVRMRGQTGSLRRSVKEDFWQAIDGATSQNDSNLTKS